MTQPAPAPQPNPTPPTPPHDDGGGMISNPSVERYDANHPTGGSNFNPNMRIDTSRAASGNPGPPVDQRMARLDTAADRQKQLNDRRQAEERARVAQEAQRLGQEAARAGEAFGRALQLQLLNKWAKELGLDW
jgi:hypothetical protein